MSGFSFNADRADVDNAYISGVVSVGTSAVEAKVDGTALAGRQKLLLYNASAAVLYFGPGGVTVTGTTRGIPLSPGELITLPVSDSVAVWLIAGTSGNDVIVQELA